MVRPSSPLAACALLLAVLSLVVLARPRGAPAPVRAEPPALAPRSTQRERLLAAEPLDLNAADVEDLRLLPRIGPTLAQRIVEERDRAGRFATVSELARVRGIGPATVERLRPLVTVSP